MTRFFLITIGLLFYSQMSAQDPFLSFDHYLGANAKKPQQLFSTYSAENNAFLIFIEDKKQLHAYLFDANGNEIDSGFSFPNIAKKFPNVAGYVYQENKYVMYLSTANKRKWAIATLDFKKKSFNLNETKLEVIGDRVLESISYKDNHYVFTVLKDTSTFQIHKLNTAGEVTLETYSFEDIDFSQAKNSVKNLDRLIQSNFSRQATVIDANSPIALETSKSRLKFYQNKEIVTLTLDSSDKITYSLSFNLDAGTSSSTTLTKETLDNEVYRTKSNSFLYDNKLFVLKYSSAAIDFTIYDAQSLQKLTSYNATKEEVISFKNTPLMQDGGTSKSEIELERTAQFLRKVSSSNPAIAVFKENDNYIITLGGTKEVSSGGSPFVIAGGALGGAIGAGLVSGLANSTLYHYNAYSRTLSTHFKLMLDTNLEFIATGEIPLNAFDDIKAFTQDTPASVLQTVCKVSDDFVWGALNNKNLRVNFFSF